VLRSSRLTECSVRPDNRRHHDALCVDRLFVEGDTIFSMEGFFDFRITHDSVAGFGVQIFANIHSLQIGPSSTPFITFSGFGLFVINSQGFAALMNLTLSANNIHGVTLNGTFTSSSTPPPRTLLTTFRPHPCRVDQWW